MRKLLCLVTGIVLTGMSALAMTSPEDDRIAFQKFFLDKFPDTTIVGFADGVYEIDAPSREQWLELEDFPPYELDVDYGQELFETPFANGKTYADCFENGGIGIRQNYPFFDLERGMVMTLELAINECRTANGEEPLPYRKGDIAAISAYMAYTSRGEPVNVVIPDDPRALAAYELGKQFYYTKRGQLNLACADCHIHASGGRLRAEILSPAVGHATGFPTYRLKWDELGTLHRRFRGCNQQVRAKGFKPQGEEYRNLEYFLTYMSNGSVFNGPAVRK